MVLRRLSVACKLCYCLRLTEFKTFVSSLLYFHFFAFSFFEYAPKKSYVTSAKVDNDAWEGAWKINLNLFTIIFR